MKLNRTPISDLKEGKYVKVAGVVKNIKDLGKIKFLELCDEQGKVQLTIKPEIYSGDEINVNNIPKYTFVECEGNVCKGLWKKGYEIEVKKLTLLGNVKKPLPIDPKPLKDPSAPSLDKRLDYRWIDLRVRKNRIPLYILSDFIKNCRDFLYSEGFTEIFTPKLMGTASESGSEVFPVFYFDKEAFLAQSPQFYKQMAICSSFEKVFEVGPVFRANPSFTTRHDTEFTSFDVEFAYIESHHDVMNLEEKMLKYSLKNIKEKWDKEIKEISGRDLNVPKKIPRIKMEEAYEIVDREDVNEDGELRPSGEMKIATHVKEEYGTDFVFVTDYPWETRPFYHMKGESMEDGTPTTRSFDLIYRGVEITTGAQREHRYEILKNQIMEKGLRPEELEYYLEFFKYGAPPHGGFGLGPTRVITAMLELKNVRNATFIPRDPKRLKP